MTEFPSIRIFVNKKETRIACKIKTGYYFQFLMPEIIKLFRNSKSKINKDENGENATLLKVY